LALSPNDGETFLREVDDELRRERVNSFFTRYGWWILAGAVLFLAAIGGTIWWRGHQVEVAGQQGETLLSALNSIEAGARNAALPKIAELSQSRVEGYRAAALFTRANSETTAGNAPAAIATLRGIAQDESMDEAYRQAALIRQTMLEFDALPPQAVVQRLRPLVHPGSPWLGSAGEMLGVAYLKLHRPNLAGPVFAAIGNDEHTPDTIRQRASQMAGALGVAVAPRDEPAGPPPAAAAPPPPPPSAQAAPAAPAAPPNQGNNPR
jgi:hypothetical protein